MLMRSLARRYARHKHAARLQQSQSQHRRSSASIRPPPEPASARRFRCTSSLGRHLKILVFKRNAEFIFEALCRNPIDESVQVHELYRAPVQVALFLQPTLNCGFRIRVGVAVGHEKTFNPVGLGWKLE